MGDKLPEGITESTWTIPPGEVIVACVLNARSPYFDPDAGLATFVVVVNACPGSGIEKW